MRNYLTRGAVAAGSALTLAVAGLAVAAAPAGAAPPAGTVDWQPCADEALAAAGAECGVVAAPLDYAAPDGAKVQLAVSRIKSKVPAAQYQGVMLVNPGGPGGSGLGMSRLGQNVPDKAGEAYDWIGFDPRGVGASRPALTCDPNYFTYRRPAYEPTTEEIEQANLAKAAGYSAACAKSGGALLNHIKSIDTVRDMDTIRAALGAEQINYYGFSYGTYLAQIYATVFPQRVRRMVIDGVLDHRDAFYQANLNQDVAFERNIGVFFGWVAANDAVFGLGKTRKQVRQAYERTRRALAAAPAGGLIGGSEFADAFLPAGYGQGSWNRIARAFSRWVNQQDAAAIKEAYDAANGPGDDNGYAVYLAVQCTDVQWPTRWRTWRKDNWDTHKKAPFYTWGNAWFNAPCLTWPAKAGKAVEVDPAKAPPVLVISEEWDGATPFKGALQARRIFPKSVLVSTPKGINHSYSLRGNLCVDYAVAAYLRNGTMPVRQPGRGPDVQCHALPQPTAAPVTAPAPADPRDESFARL